MTTLETRRPTRTPPEPIDGASVGAPTPHPTIGDPKPIRSASGGDPSPKQAAIYVSTSAGHTLLDPSLAFAADILDDIEKVWVANQNRLRILTTPSDQPDKDGECRGFGLTEDHPDVARLAAMVDALTKLNDNATKHLEKVMRRHPLHSWIKEQRGLGDKQMARLLAAIGDPYIRPELTREDGTVEPSRPRRMYELYAYCGYHVLPASQGLNGTQEVFAGRGSAGGGDIGQGGDENHGVAAGVAPRRRRNQQSNWNETARKRAWLIADSVKKQRCAPCKNANGEHVAECTCSPYRMLYDATKAKYADRVHTAPCVLCGSKGKPAEVGTLRKPGHVDACGYRAVAKAVLKDLWIEARRLHLADEGGAR